MSTAASGGQKKHLTNGYATIPNSIIENQAFLTRAELALALIVVRRGGVGDPVTVTDQTWETWTGLGARQKEYAITGLKKKGLEIVGRGDHAKYKWARDMWESYARQANRELAARRAKTEGRAIAVPAKKGAMVHPACHEGGCSLLKDSTPSNSGFVVLPGGGTVRAVGPATVLGNNDWPASLDAARAAFPIVSLAFIGRLVAIVRATVGPVTDAELARGITYAWRHKRGRQESPGLFLTTVPEALAAYRRLNVTAETIARERAAETETTLRAVLATVRAELERHRPGFDAILPELDHLAALEMGDELDAALDECRARITAIAAGLLNADGRARAGDEARREASKYPKMSEIQRDAVRRQFYDAAVLRILGITKLSLL